MPKRELYAGEVAGMRVVSANPNLSPQEMSFLTALAEAKRGKRRGRTFHGDVVLCLCKDQKYMDLVHAHVIVREGEEVVDILPIFSRTQGSAFLAKLEERGLLKPGQIAALTASIQKLIKCERVTWPPNPAVDARFVHAHIADDAVRALCSPKE